MTVTWRLRRPCFFPADLLSMLSSQGNGFRLTVSTTAAAAQQTAAKPVPRVRESERERDRERETYDTNNNKRPTRLRASRYDLHTPLSAAVVSRGCCCSGRCQLGNQSLNASMFPRTATLARRLRK